MFCAPSQVLARQLRGHRGLLCITVVCATLASVDGRAQSVLTLEQALQVAQQRSLQFAAHDAIARASRELAVAAGQRPDPTLSIGINNLPVSGGDRFSLTRDFMTMRSIGVAQEITRSDKLLARSARFDRDAEAAVAARVVALTNLRRDTAQAWFERYYQERMADLLRAQRAAAALQIDAAQAAFRGARGGLTEVVAARSAVALIDDRIRQAERLASSAQSKLVRWVGAHGNLALGAPPSVTTVHLDAAALESQLAHHPQLALLQKQEAAAQADADIARSNQQADWSVGLMFSQRGSAYSNMVSVNVSIPLQFDQKNRQDRELAAKLAVVEQLRAQREEAAREHLTETLVWLQQWRGDQDRLAHYDRELIVLAAERTRAALAAYNGGAGSTAGSGTLAAVLEARRMEIDIRMDRLRLEMEAAAQWAQLEYLLPPEPLAAAPARAALDSVDRSADRVIGPAMNPATNPAMARTTNPVEN